MNFWCLLQYLITCHQIVIVFYVIVVTLPCLTTIRKITSYSILSPKNEQTDNAFLFYIKQKSKVLQSSDKTVYLLIDKIHLNLYFDYKGGNIVGAATDRTNAATSTYAFMISSVFSNYKDVVHVLPTSKLTADNLFSFIRKTITCLESIDIRAISVITENNSINRKAMSFFFFSTPHATFDCLSLSLYLFSPTFLPL